jgi:hypothetical protein
MTAVGPTDRWWVEKGTDTERTVVMASETTFPAPRLIEAEGLGDLYRALVAEG